MRESQRRRRDDEDERERTRGRWDTAIPAWAMVLLVVFTGFAGVWWGTQNVKEDVPKLQSDVRAIDNRLDRVVTRLGLKVKDLRRDTNGLEDDTTDVEARLIVVQESLDDLLTLVNDEARE
jgi:hypothetical protein